MTLSYSARPARPRQSHELPEAFLAFGVCAIFILTSLVPMIPTANADPTEIVNGDGNREIHWNFSDPANYTLSNTTVSGGHATLEWKNEKSVENTKGDYDQAVVKQNIDTTAYPGSVVIGYRPQPVTTLTFRPGPAVSKDTYIAQDNPGNNFGTSNILDFNSKTGAQKRPLLYFDVGSIPSNASIVNATIWLWVKTGQNSPFTFTVHALNSTYSELSADWTHYSATGLWNVSGGDYSTASYVQGEMTNTVGWHGYEIGALIEDWINGILQNRGLIFVAQSSTGMNTDKQVVSSDDGSNQTQWPTLRVNYTLKTGPGDLESMAIGPGTNATFTSVNWSGSVMSLATDEFNSNSLNPRWSWMRDPRSMGGTYDVGSTRPGWLRILGGPNTYSNTVVLKANYLYENITGDFTATTHLEEQFSANSMGAGMLLMYDQHNWVSIVKYGSGPSAKLWVSPYQDDVGLSGPQVAWSGLTSVYLAIDKTGSGAQINYSADGISWTPIYDYVPVHTFASRVTIGLEVYSNTATLPIVLFDYCRINSFTDTTTLQVETRLGNSTSLTDPSWTAWSGPLSSPATLDLTAKYIQYSVHLVSADGWTSPVFSGIEIHYERYAADGVVTTLEMTIPLLKRWVSIWTFEDYFGGVVSYNYSTDHGSYWTDLVNKYPNSVGSSSQSMIIRAFIHTSDTLSTPRLNLINATYSMSPATFYISAPSKVGAGVPFMITVSAKDEFNNTIPWTGDASLHARDSTGMLDATAELFITTISISGIGSSVLPGEKYFTAETITIMASDGTNAGLSDPIMILPGPVANVSISPSISAMDENTSRDFTATAYDIYGNVNSTASLSWSVDSVLGTINASSGRSVRLSVGAPFVTGNLSVSSSGHTDSLRITVIQMKFPPTILPIPRQVRDEDSEPWVLDLAPYISDPDDATSSLRYRITDQTIVTVEAGPGALNVTFRTLPDLNGVDNLTLVVTDPSGLSTRATIVVEIKPINDAPTIDRIDPLVVHYDVPYIYSMRYYVHDVDAPLDQLTLSVDATNAPHVLVDGLTLTFMYPVGFNGSTQLVDVRVSDGELSGSTTIQVTISWDQVPVLTNPLPDVTLDQGTSLLNAFDLDQYFRDPDMDVMFYAFGNSHVSIDIQMNHTVDFHAPNDWSGVEHVTFRATDSKGARVESTIKVTVIPVNQPPVISGVPDLVVHHDSQYDFDLAPYIHDLDGDREARTITTDDGHVTVNGTVMSLLYPQVMSGMKVQVMITVHDSGLLDSWTINVTVSDDYPPVLSHMMPDHSFYEDNQIDYPIGTDLKTFFADPDGGNLRFEAFVSTPNVTATTMTESGKWIVRFTPDLNYNGLSNLTIRAIEVTTGGIAENTVRLTVVPVPDAPEMRIPAKFNVTEGVQAIMDMSKMARDPDSQLSSLNFAVSGPFTELGDIRVQNSILILVFPKGFVPLGADAKEFSINITVYDETGLSSEAVMIVHVQRPLINSVAEPLSPWFIVGMIALASAAVGGIGIAILRRKKPFVIRDMMLIHNDGFLISRFASPHTGEIDEDVLSGMLTAVLNFVEDSMSSSQDQLKTFGFKEYQVLVSRGSKTFVAIVYEGDAPSDIDKPLNEFINKIEKIYRKKIAAWTGDIETDFAGAGVLLEAFVKEHDQGSGKKPLAGLWTHKQRPAVPEK
jgi:hypothetical protein